MKGEQGVDDTQPFYESSSLLASACHVVRVPRTSPVPPPNGTSVRLQRSRSTLPPLTVSVLITRTGGDRIVRADEEFEVSVETIRGWSRLRNLVLWFVTSLATQGAGMVPPERTALVRAHGSSKVLQRIPDRWDLVSGGWQSEGGNVIDTLLADLGEMTASEFRAKWLSGSD